MGRRSGGILSLKVDGELFQAKGEFTYNLGQPKREAVVGADEVHGYKELPQTPFIEGAITDSEDLDLEKLVLTKDATITLQVANGKVIVLREGWYAADGAVTSEEGEIEVRFEGIRAEEVR
jgi:hypothetical protein